MRGSILAACANLHQQHPDLTARSDGQRCAIIDLLRQLVMIVGHRPCTPPFAPLGDGFLRDLMELNTAQIEETEKAIERARNQK